jgi:hypothetical protein
MDNIEMILCYCPYHTFCLHLDRGGCYTLKQSRYQFITYRYLTNTKYVTVSAGERSLCVHAPRGSVFRYMEGSNQVTLNQDADTPPVDISGVKASDGGPCQPSCC